MSVQNGVNANIAFHGKKTPLFYASVLGHIDIVTVLVENGADVDFCDFKFKSPLCAAS